VFRKYHVHLIGFPDLRIPEENGASMINLDAASLRQFEALYKEHCFELLDQAVALNFSGYWTLSKA